MHHTVSDCHIVMSYCILSYFVLLSYGVNKYLQVQESGSCWGFFVVVFHPASQWSILFFCQCVLLHRSPPPAALDMESPHQHGISLSRANVILLHFLQSSLAPPKERDRDTVEKRKRRERDCMQTRPYSQNQNTMTGGR